MRLGREHLNIGSLKTSRLPASNSADSMPERAAQVMVAVAQQLEASGTIGKLHRQHSMWKSHPMICILSQPNGWRVVQRASKFKSVNVVRTA